MAGGGILEFMEFMSFNRKMRIIESIARAAIGALHLQFGYTWAGRKLRLPKDVETALKIRDICNILGAMTTTLATIADSLGSREVTKKLAMAGAAVDTVEVVDILATAPIKNRTCRPEECDWFGSVKAVEALWDALSLLFTVPSLACNVKGMLKGRIWEE